MSVLGSKRHYPLRLLKVDAAGDAGTAAAHLAMAALGPFIGMAAAATQRRAPHIMTEHDVSLGAAEPTLRGRLAYQPRHLHSGRR